jgi:hypothetical protein
MTTEQLTAALKGVLKKMVVSSNNVFTIIVTDKLLKNNKARWSAADTRLYVSPAANTLLLDPETFDAALEGLEITWELINAE